MSTNEPPITPPPPSEPPTGGYGQAPPPPPPAPPSGSGGYSASTAWSYGWSKFTANLGQILLAIIVLVVALLVIQAIGYGIGRAVACDPSVDYNSTSGTVTVDDCSGIFSLQNAVQWLFSLASWVISMIIGAGIVRGALDITEGKELDPKTLLTPKKLGPVIVASILVGIATFVGFILLVIPGLLVAFF